MDILFEIYACKELPIDRMYVIRSFSEIGHIFLFPFDITENMT